MPNKAHIHARLKASNAMRDHYKELFETSVSELKFKNMEIDFLYTALDEIASMTNDNLTRMVAENMKQRHQLDKLIHTRTLFSHK